MKQNNRIHKKSQEQEKTERKQKAKDFSKAFDDLPDGAFFAMAGHMGLDYDDFIPEDQSRHKPKGQKR